MKIKKSYLIVFILILHFNLIFQGTTNLFNGQYHKSSIRVATSLSASNSVELNWYCTWGGNLYDEAHGVAVDSSDNIYIAGLTNSFGAMDAVLVKYDSSGMQQWNRTWGGDIYDEAHGVAVDSSDNIYITGFTNSFGDMDAVLVKYDSSGMQQWNRTWNGGGYDKAHGVAVDSLDNIYITGEMDAILVKYNSSGDLQWNRTWDGGGEVHGVAVDSSDNIYIAGETPYSEEDAEDMFLLKYSSSGVQQWSRTWGGSECDVAKGVAVDSLDNIYIVGDTRSIVVGEIDMILVKYDSFGDRQWIRIWGGIDEDRGYGVGVDSLDDIYITGYTTSSDVGGRDMVLVKYDSSGVQQWSRIWGGISSSIANGVALDSSENIYLAGVTYSFGAGGGDMILVKYGKAEEKNEREIISGYNFLFIIYAICIITVLSLKKRHY